jgi:hypothetical protein
MTIRSGFPIEIRVVPNARDRESGDEAEGGGGAWNRNLNDCRSGTKVAIQAVHTLAGNGL